MDLRSAYRTRLDGDWPIAEALLRRCTSEVALEDVWAWLQQHVLPTWPELWVDMLAEEMERCREEL